MYLLSFVLLLVAILSSMSFSLLEQERNVHPFVCEMLARKQTRLEYVQKLQAQAQYDKCKLKSGGNNTSNISSARAFIPLHMLVDEPQKADFVKETLLRWMQREFKDEQFLAADNKEVLFAQMLTAFQQKLQALQEGHTLDKEHIGQLLFEKEEMQKLFYYLWEGLESDSGLILPLKEFSTLQGDGKLRLWLAPRNILLLFFNEEEVQNIVQVRMNLFRQLKREVIDQETASSLFSDALSGSVRESESPWFDCSVSTSSPSIYEAK